MLASSDQYAVSPIRNVGGTVAVKSIVSEDYSFVKKNARYVGGGVRNGSLSERLLACMACNQQDRLNIICVLRYNNSYHDNYSKTRMECSCCI